MTSTFHITIAAASKERNTICAGKGDVLRPAHVKAYHGLLFNHPVPAWLTQEMAAKVCSTGTGAMTDAQRKEVNALLENIVTGGYGSKVHIWAKGLCAFLLLTSPSTEA